MGAKAFDRAEERKIELLKAAGFNALRLSHNPPSTALLNACDRLGMLVIDEAFDMWRYGHYQYDYAQYFDKLWKEDLHSMVARDRNHPSVIMWSIGNEIKNKETAEIVDICRELTGFVKSLIQRGLLRRELILLLMQRMIFWLLWMFVVIITV